MVRNRFETIQIAERRRDAALTALTDGIPYIGFLGISFDRRGDELTGVLKFDEKLIGNPLLPALHGGVTAAFLEVTAIMTLGWAHLFARVEANDPDAAALSADSLPALSKTIDFTVDYLRSGLPRDAYARATINRAGRRYASVRVEAWQDHHAKLFAQATGHFLMPPPKADP